MNNFLISAALFTYFAITHSNGMPSECGKGSFQTGGKCQLCPPGTYQNATDATSCLPCPRGHYFPYRGGQSIVVCRACPENTFLDKTGATSQNECKRCPKGTSSPAGSFGCLTCPKGKFVALCRPAQSDNDCTGDGIPLFGVCVVSDFCTFDTTFTPQELLCAPCNLQECECQGGFFTKKGLCRTCPAGTTSNGQACEPCRNFQISKRATFDCENCPAGSQGNKRSGATTCVKCPPKTFKATGAACKKCKTNENSIVVGAESCQRDETPCASNFFRTRIGTCEQCTREERYDRRMNKCVPCRPNETSLGGVSTKCTACPRGAIGTPDGCVCAPGWELDIDGMCQKCEPGFAKEEPGVAFCSACDGAVFLGDRGSVAPNAGMKRCTPCPEGTRQDGDGQTTCNRLNCRKGVVLNSEKSACIDPATSCPPDYSLIVGSDLISVCNPNTCPPRTRRTYNPDGSVLSVSCDTCSEGFIFDTKNNDCKFCGDNAVSNGVSDTTCTKCPEGYSASQRSKCLCGSGRQVLNGKCVKCPRGSFRVDISADGCLPCPAGTFARKDGGKCDLCAAGQFSEAGATKCKPCPSGSTTFGRGEANCVRLGTQ